MCSERAAHVRLLKLLLVDESPRKVVSVIYLVEIKTPDTYLLSEKFHVLKANAEHNIGFSAVYV